MGGKQKSGGGQKKVGRDKVKCASYKNRGLREKAKLVNFKKHNIPKDIDEKDRVVLISSFKELQENKKKMVK